MDWFRMYNDARTDKKLESLTDSQHRVWFSLICLASEQNDEKRGKVPCDNLAILAVEVARGNESLLLETLEKLEALDIIRKKAHYIIFQHWNERQFVSDSSTKRVQKHREKSRSTGKPRPATVSEPERNVSETLQERSSNVAVTAMKRDVTPPDPETDPQTDTELRTWEPPFGGTPTNVGVSEGEDAPFCSPVDKAVDNSENADGERGSSDGGPEIAEKPPAKETTPEDVKRALVAQYRDIVPVDRHAETDYARFGRMCKQLPLDAVRAGVDALDAALIKGQDIGKPLNYVYAAAKRWTAEPALTNGHGHTGHGPRDRPAPDVATPEGLHAWIDALPKEPPGTQKLREIWERGR